MSSLIRLVRAVALFSALALTASLTQAASVMPVKKPTPQKTTPVATPAAEPTGPAINANLKDAFYHLPIPGIDKAMDSLFNALQKGESGGYGAQTTVDIPAVGKVPLQLYFFGQAEKQVLMLIVDASIEVPKVFNNRTWQKLAGSKLSDPIFTVSTTDFMLKTSEMPAAYQKVVADSYFKVGALSFTSGFQVAARIHLGTVIHEVLKKALAVPMDDLTLRAGVVIPVPADAASAAQLSAELAADMKNVGRVLKDQPNFFVELQPEPGTVFKAPMGMSSLLLSDATFSLDSSLFFGFKGNLLVPSGKKYITYFDAPIPIEPQGIMELTSFDFGFTAQTVTYKDLVELSMAMSKPDVPGGGPLIKGLKGYMDQLRAMSDALAVFAISNPNTIGEYTFGDATRPFPRKEAFNLAIAGPTASVSDSNGRQISGPYFVAMGDLKVLGQKMGTGRLTIGESGFHSLATAGVSLRLGPLGKTGMNMKATADIDARQQNLLMHSDVIGRVFDASLDTTTLHVSSPATCATPFSLGATMKIEPSLDLSNIMDATGGVNVDPAKLQNCIGEDLKKAYQWVSSTGSSLEGYTASAANAELKKIDDAEKAAQKAVQDAYNHTKDLAREAANNSTSAAMNAFREADNAMRKLGFKKKKHHKGPDPKFAASVFDWDFYYDIRPDVVAAGVDLAQHWRDSGFYEGRQGADTFSASFYLNRYSDVKAACGNDLACALQHWLDEGINEGRQGSPQFSVSAYMRRYGDLQQAFGREGYADALQHWIDNNNDGTRDGSPDSTASGPISGAKMAGGDGGDPWTDRDVTCGPDEYVTGFRLKYGGSIDGVQFAYGNGKWAASHGYQGGGWRVDVTLSPGEYITRVDYSSGGRFDKVQFTTNTGRVFGPYGGGNFNGSYSVTPGQKLGCMWGRSGSSIDKMVFSSTGPR